MTVVNPSVDATIRVLRKASVEFSALGPWRWQCVMQNGSALPLTAALEDGFLHLAGRLEAKNRTGRELGQALREDHRLAGGVKFALSSASGGLHLRSEIPFTEEARLVDRVHRALVGFHQGCERLKALDCPHADAAPVPATAPVMDLGDLLREASWPCSERGPNDFAVDLHLASAPPARASATAGGIELRIDLVRCAPAEHVPSQALAVFLLTANGALRMVRAHVLEIEEMVFGFHVCLEAPTAEEVDHALAAISIAHRACAREASVLLDEAAARCYLAVRNVPLLSNQENEKEN